MGPFELEGRLGVSADSHALIILVHDTPAALNDSGSARSDAQRRLSRSVVLGSRACASAR